MRKIKVGCWKRHIIPGDWSSDTVYITIPAHSYGHDLVSCLNCGEVYAYAVMDPFYLGPSLEEKLKQTECVKCGANLGETAKSYPEYYLGSDRRVHQTSIGRAGREEEQITCEFWGLYEKDDR